MVLYFSFSGIHFTFSCDSKILLNETSKQFCAEKNADSIQIKFTKTNSFPQSVTFLSDKTFGIAKNEKDSFPVYFDFASKEPFMYVNYIDNNYHCYYSDEKFLETRFLWNCIDLPGILLDRQRIQFHSSYIDYNGSGILFCGKSGIGKSTQAELWRQFAGAEIINGDKSVIYSQNGKAVVSSLPVAGTSGICKNRILPLKAVIVLEQGKENKLTKLNPIEALTSMMKSCIIDTWKNSETDKCISVLAQILKTAEVYIFSCLPDKSAVDTLRKVLYNSTDRGETCEPD